MMDRMQSATPLKDLFLGIDAGTSGCKLALVDIYGDIQFTVTEPYPSYYPAPGLVEQSPDEWWAAIARGLQKFWAMGANPKSIAAISADGQSFSAIPLDKNGNLLANTPLWMDTRAAQICETWEKRIGFEPIFAVGGNPFSPTYTLPKLLYFMEHQPDVIKKAAYILQSNAYIVYRLTKKATIDYSMTYGWHNFSQSKLCYDEALTKAFGISPRFLLEPVPSHQIVGHITSEAARFTGLAAGTPVVAGGLDAACSTLGVGVIESGQVQEQGGQAGGMSICQDSALAHRRLILSPHVVPHKWLLQGGSVGGGASLKYFAEQLAHKGIKENAAGDTYIELSRLAAESPAGANGLLFLPYLSGERSPIWDSKARGMYFGISYSTAYRDFVRATMEGVALSLCHNIETAKEAGADIKSLFGTGGSANSHIWTQIKSDATGLPLHIPASDAATVRGAAMLAMLGAGAYKSFEDAVRAIVHIERSHTPNAVNTALYKRLLEIYIRLYDNTAACMHALSQYDKNIENI